MDTFNLFYHQPLSEEALHFLETSSMTPYNAVDMGLRIHALMKSPFYSAQMAGHRMENGWIDSVSLPEGDPSPDATRLRQIQGMRKSSRDLKGGIPFEKLAGTLRDTYFVTEEFEQHSHHLARRSIASGGALYPIDLYYLSLDTASLEGGVYAYNPHLERLERLQSLDRKAAAEAFAKVFPPALSGEWNPDSLGGVVFFAAELLRVACKYGDRGLRFALMDVGALCQNLQLAAACHGLKCCAIGGYFDHAADQLLQLDGLDETTLLALFIGQ